MKALIVWAHPEARSFNRQMVDAAQAALTGAGHEVRVTDLYRSGFKAVADGNDFGTRQREDRLVYDEEQLAAVSGDGLADDIAAQVEDLRWCDLLILQFPLWWFSVPAIMKGWIDRVMAKGVAYGGGRWYDRGGFHGRRAMLSLTTAAWESMCSPRGINGDIDVILWPLQQGVLRFTGFEALSPNIVWSSSYTDAAAHEAALEQWRTRLATIEQEAPEPCYRREDFGRDWQLREDAPLLTVGHRPR